MEDGAGFLFVTSCLSVTYFLLLLCLLLPPLSVSLLMAFSSPLLIPSLLPYCRSSLLLFCFLFLHTSPSHYFQLLITILFNLCHSSSSSAPCLPPPHYFPFPLLLLLSSSRSPALQSSSFLVAGRGKEEAEFTVEVRVSQVLTYLRSGDQVPEDRRQNRGQRSQTPCEPNMSMILGLTRLSHDLSHVCCCTITPVRHQQFAVCFWGNFHVGGQLCWRGGKASQFSNDRTTLAVAVKTS